MKTIKLGRKAGEPPMGMTMSQSETHYPSFYVDNVPGIESLPDEGVMTIRYKVCSKNTSERDGKKSVSVSIDVVAIEDAEASEAGEKEKDSDDKPDLSISASEALDKIREAISEKESY